MKKTILALSATALLAVGLGGVAHAATPQELAKKHNCMACHSVDKKVVGPSFKEIAARYKGKNADATLVGKVIKGSTGVWGPVPMPPNAGVPEADAKTLVKWVLSQ